MVEVGDDQVADRSLEVIAEAFALVAQVEPCEHRQPGRQIVAAALAEDLWQAGSPGGIAEFEPIAVEPVEGRLFESSQPLKHAPAEQAQMEVGGLFAQMVVMQAGAAFAGGH